MKIPYPLFIAGLMLLIVMAIVEIEQSTFDGMHRIYIRLVKPIGFACMVGAILAKVFCALALQPFLIFMVLSIILLLYEDEIEWKIKKIKDRKDRKKMQAVDDDDFTI